MKEYVWVIWQYDNGIVPEKTIWSICKTKEIADAELERIKPNTNYEYEIEKELLQTKGVKNV